MLAKDNTFAACRQHHHHRTSTMGLAWPSSLGRLLPGASPDICLAFTRHSPDIHPTFTQHFPRTLGPRHRPYAQCRAKNSTGAKMAVVKYSKRPGRARKCKPATTFNGYPRDYQAAFLCRPARPGCCRRAGWNRPCPVGGRRRGCQPQCHPHHAGPDSSRRRLGRPGQAAGSRQARLSLIHI